MNNYPTHLFSRALTSQRGGNPVTLLRRASWVLLPALLFVAAPRAAVADASAVTDWITFPTLSVASDGDSYTTTAGFASGWEARFTINARGASRVKNWTFYPTLALGGVAGFEGLPKVELSGYEISKSYAFGQRPKDVDQTVGRVFPNAVVSDFAVALCNRNLENLMNQGLSKQQVLAQDRELVLSSGLDGNLSVDLTFGETTEEVSIHNLEITCQKSPFKPVEPGAGGLTAATRFRLDNATLDISPSQYKGACPKDLTLTMEVQGNLSDTFEARIESTAGWKSTKIVLATNEFDESSGLWGRAFAAPLTLPLTYPAAGGGIGPGPGELAPNPGKGTGGGIQTVGGLTSTDPGWNVHQQSLRLVAIANGNTVYSSWQQYRVTCDPKPAIGTPSSDLAPGTGGGSKPTQPSTPAPTPAPQTKGARSPLETKAGTPPSTVQKEVPSPKQSAKPSPPSPTRKATPGASGMPDLQVLAARASAARPGAIEFLVGNTGTADSTRSIARLSCGGRIGAGKSWDAPLPAIQAGGKEWIASDAPKQRSTRASAADCTITLDPKNAVAESDEGNNRHSCKGCQAGR